MGCVHSDGSVTYKGKCYKALGKAVVIRKVRGSRRRGANVVARLRGKATVRLSTNEILAFTRG